MDILLYSPVFSPSIGGVETITDTLAQNILQLGHRCVVVTETPCNQGYDDQFAYQVVRQPSIRARLRLAKACDLIHSNSASVAMCPYAILAGKPFIWTHNGYQVSCVDGLGWVEGKAAPMTPIKSLQFHFHRSGLIATLKNALKLGLRRFVAKYIVRLNCAATKWVAYRQNLPRQVIAYTPYALSRFLAAKQPTKWEYHFIYVGRLVSEKGINQLLEAFHLLMTKGGASHAKLLIVGDGNLRESLESKVHEWGIGSNICFAGAQRGDDLIHQIEKAEIAVVPSEWEEPMGGVSLELLAAGKCLIVSSDGGHAEVVGNAGVTFKNGDSIGLSQKMLALLQDGAMRHRLRANAPARLKLFAPEKLTENYIRIYQEIISGGQSG